MLKKRVLYIGVSGLVFATILVPALPIRAEGISNHWHQVENRGDCKYAHVLDGTPQWSRWTGACTNGFVQGSGTITYKGELGENTITGIFKDGRLTSLAEVSGWLADDIEPLRYEYKGPFGSDLAGYGTFQIGDALHYSGQFDNLQFNGYGELKTEEFTYFGMFKDSKYDGLGTYALEEELTFKGEFANGEADGLGVLEINSEQYNLNLRIVGRFKGPIEVPFNEFEVIGPAIMESEGEEKFRYTGEIFDFYMHGQGVQVLDTGHRHEGMFKKGRRHGPGISIDPDGDICEGEWKEGTLIEHGNGILNGQSAPCAVDKNGDITFPSDR